MENGSNIIDPTTNMPFTHRVGPQTISNPLDAFPPLGPDEIKVLRITAEKSLIDGHSPTVPVAFPLQAMCQIVTLIEHLEQKIESAYPMIRRQLLHGKHEQDREDAKAWIDGLDGNLSARVSDDDANHISKDESNGNG